MKAVLVISHGSHSAQTVDEIKSLIAKLKKTRPELIIEYAFLEIAIPSIPDGIRNCITKGAQEVRVVLNFLNAGKHVDVDIPRIVGETQKQFLNVKMSISKPVGQHSKIVDLFLDLMAS